MAKHTINRIYSIVGGSVFGIFDGLMVNVSEIEQQSIENELRKLFQLT
ncbi:hypothetical protein [Ornithinibacillus massiliensis]|nr:hypothetical protein [Ornithinibacillus massiliensis]